MAYTIRHYIKGLLKKENNTVNMTSTMYVALFKRSMGVDTANHEYFSDISFDELNPTVVGAWYTKGGQELGARTFDIYGAMIVRIDAPDEVFASCDTDDLGYGILFWPIGAATGGYPFNPAQSILYGVVDFGEQLTIDGYDFPLIWGAQGIDYLTVPTITDQRPQVNMAYLAAANITQSGYTVTYSQAASVTDPDNTGAQVIFELVQGSTADSANVLSTGAGQKAFTAAQMVAGVAIVKANSEGLTTLSIRAVSSTSGGGAFATINLTVPANQPPSVPTGLQESSKTTTSVVISFTGATDPDAGDFVEAYRLYLNTTGVAPTVGVTAPFLANTGGTLGSPPATSFNASGQTPGSTVYGWVTSRDNNGNESALSSMITISIPSNMPPSVGAGNILVSGASASVAGTIDAFTVKIGTVSNADTIKTVRVALFTAAELADKDTNWGTIPAGRKIELVAGVDDAAITAIQSGSGQAFTGKALTKDVTYTPSVIVEETKSEGGTQWGSWAEATATVLYASPTCTVQAPTNVVAETTAAGNNGSLTANGTTAAGIQRNVTRWRISVGPSSVGDGDPTNVACQVLGPFTGKNVAANTAFTEALTALNLPAGNHRMWAQVGDELAGLGAWTPTPAAFTVYPIISSIDVTSPTPTGYTIECDSNVEAAEYTQLEVFISTTSYALGTVPADTNDAAITSARDAAGTDYKETVAQGATLTSIIGAGGAITESAIAAGTYYAYIRGVSNGVTGLWAKGAATFAVASPLYDFNGSNGEQAPSPWVTSLGGSGVSFLQNGSGQLVGKRTTNTNKGIAAIGGYTFNDNFKYEVKAKAVTLSAIFRTLVLDVTTGATPAHDTVGMDMVTGTYNDAGTLKATFAYVAASGWTIWNAATNVWGASWTTGYALSVGTYYVFEFISEYNSGSPRWKLKVWDATKSTLLDETDYVAWANTKTATTDSIASTDKIWLVLPLVETGAGYESTECHYDYVWAGLTG